MTGKGLASMRLAVACAIVPMAVGIFVFLAWLFTRWGGWILAGFATIALGLAAFAVGLWAWDRFVREGLRLPVPLRRRQVFVSYALAALLLLNFPLAGTLVYLYKEVASSWIVVLHNEGSESLVNVEVFGRRVHKEIGTVASGESSRATLRGLADGSPLTIRYTVDGAPHEQDLEYYFFYYGGERVQLRVDSAGEFHID
jgi:hypothetical protein